MKNNKKKIVMPDISIKRICKAYLFVIVSVPISIYASYYLSGVSICLPSPMDIVRYFGTTIGGLATLVAIFITISKEKERREEEKALQEEEKKRDARVLIIMDSNIMFSDFNEFGKYSHNTKISKLYYFHEWLPQEDKELPWITQPYHSDPYQQYRFASFIVTNPTDKPIYEVCISVNVDVVPITIDNGVIVEGKSTLKKYESVEFTVLPQQSKVAFALPWFKEKQHLARYVKITYRTPMKEQMRYECEYSRGEGTAIEKYYAGDEELFCTNKKTAVFYDLNHWKEN
jgi:hypothetical protein